MKREGRQHGMVKTHCNLPFTSADIIFPKKTTSKLVSINGAPPTAGVFTRVTSKPTNHSKFTGKCSRVRCSSCHLRPCSKSKDKAKGSYKHRSEMSSAQLSLKLDGYSSAVVLDEIHDYTRPENYVDED